MCRGHPWSGQTLRGAAPTETPTLIPSPTLTPLPTATRVPVDVGKLIYTSLPPIITVAPGAAITVMVDRDLEIW